MLHRSISNSSIKSLFLVALCASSIIFGFYQNANAYVYPGSPSGYVNDFARVLSPSEIQKINQTISTFQASTTNEIAVVTIPSLGGDTIDNYAVRLFEDWKIGTKQNDNGILLLAAIEDRELRIEVGYGLEGALPDSVADRIIRNDIVPYFREGKYGDGIIAGVGSIMSATKGEYVAGSKNESFDFSGAADFFSSVSFGLITFMGFVFLNILIRLSVLFFGKSKSWWMGGVSGLIVGIFVSLFVGFFFTGIFITVGLVLLGLLLDFLASKGIIKNPPPGRSNGSHWGGGFGGGSSGSSGGGFGGFGGGSSGGGGASGRW